jgi:hypothetical protein
MGLLCQLSTFLFLSVLHYYLFLVFYFELTVYTFFSRRHSSERHIFSCYRACYCVCASPQLSYNIDCLCLCLFLFFHFAF